MIKVCRTLDVGLIVNIIKNDEIFDSISEDGATMRNVKIDVIKDFWLEIYEIKNEKITTIGVISLISEFKNKYDCHIHILPEKRENSKKAGEMILEWCSKNIKGALLYTNVPVFCKSVIGFLLSFGFKEQGILEGAWFKNGEQHNMKILTKVVI